MDTIPIQTEIPLSIEPAKKAHRRRGSDRFPRYERAQGDLPGLGTSPYDFSIFDALCRFRALTRQQIEAFLAPGAKRTRIGERLQKLYHHGFIERKVMPLAPPTSLIVYLLDRKGADALANARGCSWNDLGWDPDDRHMGTQFLRHTQLVNNAYFTIARYAADCGYVLETVADGRALKRAHKEDDITITVECKDTQGREYTKVVPTHLFPDYYFYLIVHPGEGGKHHRFLELDNATETVTPGVNAPSSWGMKVKRYLAYWEQGKFQNRYNANGMVVLTLTTGDATRDVRLKNLKRVAEHESRRAVENGSRLLDPERRFWFTTVGEFFDPAVNVLTDPIWQRGGAEGRFTFTEDVREAQQSRESA